MLMVNLTGIEITRQQIDQSIIPIPFFGLRSTVAVIIIEKAGFAGREFFVYMCFALSLGRERD